MSYTQQDVKDLRDALLAAKTSRLRTHEAMDVAFDMGVDTMRVAEALAALKDAHDKLDKAVDLLDHEYNRIGLEVAVEEAAGVQR